MMISHMNSDHETFHCDECGMEIPDRKKLVRHKKQHKYIPHHNMTAKNGMIDCTECDQKVQITKLVLHYKQSHNSLPPGT